MTDPKNISISEYTYSLPEERIAKYPLAERDFSKLLIYEHGKIAEDTYRNIADHIPTDSLLVFNNTKVVEARLLFQKVTGGVIEIFCLEPGAQYADITSAMLQRQRVYWECLVGGASKWKPGQVLEKKIQVEGEEIVLQARYTEKRKDSFIIELSWEPVALSFAEVLHYAGAIPLPPYIKRAADETDAKRYQTVYAKHNGSVAAPTAGLHFTESIFRSLKEKDIRTEYVTLHVGAGTFKPVKSETMQDHDMHAEWIDVSTYTIENILLSLDKNIIAVGTTSLRTIESLYWLGVKQLTDHRRQTTDNRQKTKDNGQQTTAGPDTTLYLSQWECYDLAKESVPAKASLESLLTWMKENKMDRLIAKTQILIVPGYEFKIVKGLITNFHQPQSTLLLLVAALIGQGPPTGRTGWKEVYSYALQNDFRFLSYGDGSLLWHNDNVSHSEGVRSPSDKDTKDTTLSSAADQQ